jgi:hypothetical protein
VPLGAREQRDATVAAQLPEMTRDQIGTRADQGRTSPVSAPSSSWSTSPLADLPLGQVDRPLQLGDATRELS